MTPELFKQIVPLITPFFLVFFKYDKKLFLVYFVLYSFFLFSSNFEFFYKNLHKLIVTSIALFALYHIAKNDFILKYNKNFKYIFLYLIVVLIGVVQIKHWQEYITSIVNLIMIIVVVYYLFLNLNTIEKIEKISIFIAQLSFIISALAVFYFFLVFQQRIEGISSNSNYFAYYMGIGFISSLFFEKESIYKIFKLLIMFYAVFLTQSRSILLSLILVLFFYGLLKSKSKKMNIIVIPVFLSIILLLVYFVMNSSERFNDINEDASSLQRVQIWIISYNIFLDHPFFGIGYGQFINEFKHYFSDSMYDLNFTLVNMDMLVTHNDYLRIITELGLIGFIVFISFITFQVKSVFTILKKYDKKIGYALLSLLIFNLLFSFAHNNMNSLLFWYISMLPFHIRHMYENDQII